MSKPVRISVDVPADVASTYAVLTGPEWPRELDARLRDGSTLVSCEPTADGGTVVVLSRRLPDGIPSFLRRFTPKDGLVTQTDRWGPEVDGVRDGTWEVTFPGSPGQVGGQTRVEPAAGGSRWVVTGSVTVSIPLVGGKAEGFLAPLVERLIAKQGEVLTSLLAQPQQ